MKKEAFLFLTVLVLLSSCTTQDISDATLGKQIEEQPTEIQQESVMEETQEEVEDTPVTPQKQDVTLNQSVQETKVQEVVNQRLTCSRKFSPQFNAAPYYNGPLFDAHFHMPPTYEEQDKGWRPPVLGKEVTLNQILCYFDKEKVTGAYAFHFWEYDNLEQSIDDATEIQKQSPQIHLFLIPSELQANELDEIVNSHNGVFDGFGEIVYYDPERPGATPDDPISLETYKVAAQHKLIVMFHPDDNQRAQVENAIQKNPDTTFLLHGWESAEYISALMDKYPNVYYSVDSATLYAFDGMLIKGPKEKFISRFKNEFTSVLNAKVTKWKPQIEKHPDRFVWGTDRAADWHYNEEISILFEEFARGFIGRLDPAVQEKYAYKNAERMLEKNGMR